MTSRPWQPALSGCDAKHPEHFEAESFLTCCQHTFMLTTCQPVFSLDRKRIRRRRVSYDSGKRENKNRGSSYELELLPKKLAHALFVPACNHALYSAPYLFVIAKRRQCREYVFGDRRGTLRQQGKQKFNGRIRPDHS